MYLQALHFLCSSSSQVHWAILAMFWLALVFALLLNAYRYLMSEFIFIFTVFATLLGKFVEQKPKQKYQWRVFLKTAWNFSNISRSGTSLHLEPKMYAFIYFRGNIWFVLKWITWIQGGCWHILNKINIIVMIHVYFCYLYQCSFCLQMLNRTPYLQSLKKIIN